MKLSRQPCKCVLVGANTGKTIHADGCADGQLVANLDAGDGKSELFTLIKNDDGSFSLKSDENGKFVSAVPPPYGYCRLDVHGQKIDAWEKIRILVKSAGSKGDVAPGVDLALPNVKQRCWKSGTELEAYIHEQKQ